MVEFTLELVVAMLGSRWEKQLRQEVRIQSDITLSNSHRILKSKGRRNSKVRPLFKQDSLDIGI